jgi:hypothetical protein
MMMETDLSRPRKGILHAATLTLCGIQLAKQLKNKCMRHSVNATLIFSLYFRHSVSEMVFLALSYVAVLEFLFHRSL